METNHTYFRALHKSSSLVLNRQLDVGHVNATVRSQPNDRCKEVSEGEVIPDSEEERACRVEELRIPEHVETYVAVSNGDNELSQDGRVDIFDEISLGPAMPGGWPSGQKSERDASSDSDECLFPSVSGLRNKPKTPRRIRRIIESSSSETSEDDDNGCNPYVMAHTERSNPPGNVIDLTLSSSEGEHNPSGKKHMNLPGSTLREKMPNVPRLERTAGKLLPLYADDDLDPSEDEPWNINDGSILTFDEPSSARKPIRIPSTSKSKEPRLSKAPTASRKPQTLLHVALGVAEKEDRPSPSNVLVPRATPSTPKQRSRTMNPKTPRTSKKAQAAMEQARREEYAKEIFDELNRAVFEEGIPKKTELKWSNRLLTTAGKARWHRSRDGVDTTEIELATKILDCDERIRNTLAHEMCHLACWIINKAANENHGKIFKSWARKVMRKRPEIEVTTRHSYEIAYKYEWKCEKCAKTYGRFSKSIRTDECVCGACKTGKLIPQFRTNQRVPQTPNTTVDSQMSATRARDSPLSLVLGTESTSRPVESSEISDSSDLEILAHRLGGVDIGRT